MNDETALMQYFPMEHVASIAEEAHGKTALERYQEGLSDETLESVKAMIWRCSNGS
jgi:hypothetical protein